MSQETETNQVVQVGFSAALDAYFPEWRTEWTQPQVELARFFYKSGIEHAGLFVRSAVANFQEGYQVGTDNIKTGFTFLHGSMMEANAKGFRKTPAEDTANGAETAPDSTV